MPDRGSRPFDVVLVGATGFTGGLTAEHLARHAPPHLRWALAGRDGSRLEEIRRRLVRAAPDAAKPPLLVADVTDPAAARRLAEAGRVVATAVGPYLRYGEPLVAACAAAGTDYADLTGEPEFVDRMYLQHHRTAVDSGARLVHACGFEAVPPDLGALHAVEQLRRLTGGPLTARVTVRGVVRSNAGLSAGTLASALGQLARGASAHRVAAERRRVEGRSSGSSGRRVRAVRDRPRRDPVLGHWLLPLPTIDPSVVVRSARAREEYGPDFRYSHAAGFRSPVTAGAAAAGGLALVGGARVPPVRRALLGRLEAGQGPTEERRLRSWFMIEFVAETDGVRVVTRVRGGDPGYSETARMLGESALCLACDENPANVGQLTPVVAMGDGLRTRLASRGLSFAVVREG